MRNTFFTALLLVATTLGVNAQNQWTSPAYQQKQWANAVKANAGIGGGYLEGVCAKRYVPVTTTTVALATSTSTRRLVTVQTATTRLTLKTTILTTTSTTSTALSTSTSTTQVTSYTPTYTTTTTTVSASPNGGNRRRHMERFGYEKRAAMATGPALVKQQIDSIVGNLQKYNEPYLKGQCAGLNNVVISTTSTRVIPTTTQSTRGTTVTKSTTSTGFSTIVKATTTTQVTLTTTTVTTTLPSLIISTSTVVIPPAPTDVPAYISCPTPPAGQYLISVKTVNYQTVCSYASKTDATAIFSCTWDSIKGTFTSSTGTVPSGACPTQLDFSDATGKGCYSSVSCPTWTGHTLYQYGSGQNLKRSGPLSSDPWELELYCSYDNNDAHCVFDEDTQEFKEGDDECPTKFDNDNQDVCVFNTDPPVDDGATTPPAATTFVVPPTSPSFKCPTNMAGATGDVLRREVFTVADANSENIQTLRCYYGTSFKVCTFKPDTGDLKPLSSDNGCASTAVSSPSYLSTWPYRTCPATMNGKDFDKVESVVQADYKPDGSKYGVATNCVYGNHDTFCIYNSATGTKSPSSDSSCPATIDAVKESPAPAPPSNPSPAPGPNQIAGATIVPRASPLAVNYVCPTKMDGTRTTVIAVEMYQLRDQNTDYDQVLGCEYTNDDGYSRSCSYLLSNGKQVTGWMRTPECPASAITSSSDVLKGSDYRACPSMNNGSLLDPMYSRFSVTRTAAGAINSTEASCRYYNGDMCFYDPVTGTKKTSYDGTTSSAGCPQVYSISQSVQPIDITRVASAAIPGLAADWKAPIKFADRPLWNPEHMYYTSGDQVSIYFYDTNISSNAGGASFNLDDGSLWAGDSAAPAYAVYQPNAPVTSFGPYGCPLKLGSANLRTDRSTFTVRFDTANDGVIRYVEAYCDYKGPTCIYDATTGILGRSHQGEAPDPSCPIAVEKAAAPTPRPSTYTVPNPAENAYKCPTNLRGRSDISLTKESWRLRDKTIGYSTIQCDYTGSGSSTPATCIWRLLDGYQQDGSDDNCASQPSSGAGYLNSYPYRICPSVLDSKILRHNSTVLSITHASTSLQTSIVCGYDEQLQCAYDPATGSQATGQPSRCPSTLASVGGTAMSAQ